MGMTFARLELTDGTTSIDLLRGGVYAKDYRPGIPALKDSGIWQDSALATGRRLIDRRFGNVIDTLDMAISGPNQNDTIARCGDLLRLLEKARDFTASSWQSAPVWLKRQAGCESNPTFALIYDYKIEQLSNPFAAPFAAATELATLDGFDLGIEHSIWLSEPPGTGACVQVSSTHTSEINAEWVLKAGLPTVGDFIFALMQSTTERIFAGDTGQIIQSDDDADSWALCTALPVGQVNCMIQTTSGRIIAGETGGVWHSHNDGGAWAFSVEAFTVVYTLLQLSGGRLLAGDDGQIWASDDDGDTWAIVTTAPTDHVIGLIQTASGRVLAVDDTRIFYSDDNGTTWAVLANLPTILYSNLIEVAIGSTGHRILVGSIEAPDGIAYKSDDDGLNWTLASTLSGSSGQIISLYQLANGRILAGVQNNKIWKSDDAGLSWALVTTDPMSGPLAFLQTATGRILSGGEHEIWASGPIIDATMGTAASCADEQFIANKANAANLTHMYVDDGGAWGINLLPCVFPVHLLPLVPAVGDAVYFGNSASNPFESLVFDIGVPLTYTVSYTIVWEYCIESHPGVHPNIWATLTVQDGTNPGGAGPFLNAGVNSVHWIPPTDWVACNLDDEAAPGPSVNGLWVRARVSANGGALTAPTQQNRNVYTLTWPEVEVAASQVAGDIPALAQIKLRNRSDKDTRGGLPSTPALYDNRIVVGLRSYSRGAAFCAYLNVSDEQNPDGVIVALSGHGGGGTCTFSNNVTTITGRLATYAAVLADNYFYSIIRFTLQSAIVSNYYGTFHAFLRAKVTAGASSDIHARLQVMTGTGGIAMISQDDYLKGTTDFEVLDFGRVSIPASGILSTADVGDNTTLSIQFRNDSGAARTVYIHDLILIPVDEWALDAVDYTNTPWSCLGGDYHKIRLLDIDSLVHQKLDVRTLVRTADMDAQVTSIYVPSGGPAILQANARQRLWVFAMRTSATGASYAWLSEPWVAHSVQIWVNERWLALRGDR